MQELKNNPVSGKWSFFETNIGFMETKNSMGVMNTYLNKFTKKFIETAAKSNKPALDVGTSFGLVTLEALEAGAKMISCDLCQDHLNVLESNTPENLKNNLSVKLAKFPDELDFEDGSLSAVLLANVVTFMDGLTFERGLKKISRWLEKDGMLVVVMMTPFFKCYVNAEPLYEINKKNEIQWPGYLPTAKAAPEIAQYLPQYIHLMKPEDLASRIAQFGYEIKEATYFSYPKGQFPEEFRNSDKEYCGVVANNL